MNPSTAQARVLVDALASFGVRDAVLAPGSRSAPLAMALADAADAGLLRLHVRIDERSAGFLALGLAKASGLPVPVAVTSGTAVANLLPAVVEASYAGVPLIVLSADRPATLRGVGAPQTIDQIKIFGDNVRSFTEVAQASDAPGQVVYWRSLVSRVAAVATNPADPGPVHLNVPFAEPLLPDLEEGFPEPLAGRPDGGAWVSPFAPSPSPVELTEVLAAMGLDEVPERGLVIVGDIPDVGWDGGPKVGYLADACGWPIIAEPSAGMHRAPTWLPAGPLLAGDPGWLADHRPEFVITVGKVGLTRQVSQLLPTVPRHLAVNPTERWADPSRTASAVLLGSVPMPPPPAATPDGRSAPRLPSSWLRAWQLAAEAVARATEQVLIDCPYFSGLHVAAQLWRAAPDNALLFLGPSWPIRQAYLTATARGGLRVLANRGANGIDGVVSTAWGAAVSHATDLGGPSYALLGDLTFLHDGNGLLVPSDEERPPLTYLVIDNDGGGIFSSLEQGRSQYASHFERIFGTPHGWNLTARARLSGIPSRQVDDEEELADALSLRPAGTSVVVAAVADRAAEAELLRTLSDEVHRALGLGDG